MTTLSAAAEHARAGRYDTARSVLAPLTGPDSTDVEALDMLARIQAQEGDLIAADTTWRQVLAHDPRHQAALAGRHRIRQLWTSTGRRRATRTVGATLAIVALVGAGTASYWLGRLGEEDRDAPGVTALQTQTTELSEEVSRLAATSQREEQAVASAAQLAAAMENPRWTVRTLDQHTTITFRAPLFESGSDVLSTEGTAALEALAEVMAGVAEEPAITVTGHVGAPAGGTTATGNHSATLGLARALAATDVLAGHGLPDRLISTTTAGDLDAPYAAADDRNQTVTVDIAFR